MSAANERIALLGKGLAAARISKRAHRILLIDGPNMNNLGAGGRDQRTYGVIDSLQGLHTQIETFAVNLGLSYQAYHSNYEAELVDKAYSLYGKVDGVLVNPAGLNRNGVPLATALRELAVPVIELHFSNITASGWPTGSVVSKNSSGIVMGLRHYSYLSAVYALTRLLDETQ